MITASLYGKVLRGDSGVSNVIKIAAGLFNSEFCPRTKCHSEAYAIRGNKRVGDGESSLVVMGQVSWPG